MSLFKKTDKELESITMRCPYCGGDVMEFMEECPHCHQPITGDSEEMKHDRRMFKAHQMSQLISILVFILLFLFTIFRNP